MRTSRQVLTALAFFFLAQLGTFDIALAFDFWPGKTTTRVNMRTAPALTAPVLAAVDANRPVQVRDARNGWYQVLLEESGYALRGWIFAKYVRPDPAPETAAQTLPEPAAKTSPAPPPDPIKTDKFEPALSLETTAPGTPSALTPEPPEETPDLLPVDAEPAPAAVAEAPAAPGPASLAEPAEAPATPPPASLPEPAMVPAPAQPGPAVLPAAPPSAPAKTAPVAPPETKPSTAKKPPAPAQAEPARPPVPLAFSILRGLLIVSALLISFIALVLSFKALRFGRKYQALAAEYRCLKEAADATKMAAKEKRHHPRVCRLVEVDFSVQGKFYRGFIRNLSAGGAFVETREALPVGQEITVSYPAPNQEGNIKRTGEIFRKNPQGVAVRFTPPA